MPPLATSLLALPLSSAVFAAGLIAVLERTLALLGMSLRLRLALLPLVALNPMIVFYSVNGMGEILSIFLLTAATYALLRWYLRPNVGAFVLMSMAFTLGVLSRYELGLWALLYGGAVVAVLIRRRASWSQIEASLLTYLVPIVYGFSLWIFFNWLIVGDPLYWLHSEVSLAFTAVRDARPAAGDTSIWAATTAATSLAWRIFPAAFPVTAALVVLAAARRDIVAGVLAAAIALNTVATIALVVGTQTTDVLQLRYNIRALPLVLLGVAWLWRSTPGNRRRAAVCATGAALMALSTVPMVHLMRTYPRQYQEQAFIRALASRHDQEGTYSIGSREPIQVGIGPERGAARWLLQHAGGRDSVLADDERAFGVMLLTGRPSLFLDRIDRGDTYWHALLDAPRGRVDYILVRRSESFPDLIQQRYPTILDGGLPWLRQVYSNVNWRIYRVASRNASGAPKRAPDVAGSASG